MEEMGETEKMGKMRSLRIPELEAMVEVAEVEPVRLLVEEEGTEVAAETEVAKLALRMFQLMGALIMVIVVAQGELEIPEIPLVLFTLWVKEIT